MEHDKEPGQSGKDRLARIKETAELASTFFKWAMLLPGGICLLAYSIEIGHFPEGTGLGEGLAFYMVCASLWIIYTIYVFMAGAMGAVAFAPLAKLAQHRHKLKADGERTSTRRLTFHTDFSSMHDASLLGPATIGYLFLFAYFPKDWQMALQFLAMVLAQGAVLAILLRFNARIRLLATPLVLGGSVGVQDSTSRSNLVAIRAVLVVMLFAIPVLFGPAKLGLVDAAFQAAQLRKQNATVHVRKPWADRVARSSLKPAPSFLGDEYAEFRGVNVLLRSVGTKVVLELPGVGKERTVNLPIPTEAIHIE